MSRPVVLVKTTRNLTVEQVDLIRKSAEAQANVDCLIVSGNGVEAELASVAPYSLQWKLGDYSWAATCQTFEELLKLQELYFPKLEDQRNVTALGPT